MELEDCPPVLPASFYKIILPGIICDKKMRIPDIFAETYGDELSRVVTLVTPDDYLWPVKVDKSDSMLCLSDGWQKLVHHYSISTGHVLFFKYKGNSCLNVSILDITSTEIDYSRHGPNSCDANGKDGSDEWESLVTREEAAAKLRIRPCFVDFLRSTLQTGEEKKRAIFAARVFTSENPCFMAVVRQCNLFRTYQMDAPVEFSASYLLPARKVELEIADGRRWITYSMEAHGGAATLKRGWGTFAKANRLAIGDICIFEVIRVDHIVVLKVSIFRSTQD